ncbi:nicotinamide riboside transporter PnuC [Undibacterium fentianense]|uniref:Nicotinamide riboside transporter PnuC n=1 Tax=Undibacterium fentianense TaxID=2828728 RepID=A0A941E4K6_9BURK|nr:nicotinamide riboside transporter PnuC [Undibacterium fentianense]MBR7798683.1 nicotinamide mononucleotide transporter [Undibacterium fentianense]
MNQTLTLIWNLTTTPLELVSFVLSVVTVLLNIRQNHWAWLFAILSSGLYGIVFFQAKLYGDSGLQFCFILISLWGWMQWLKPSDTQQELVVSRLDARGFLFSLLSWFGLFACLFVFLRVATDTDVPLADGFLTAGSVLGQILLSRKKIENWYVWILVDILYVGLYLYKNLVLTAGLYAIFVGLAFAGARVWQAMEKKQGMV